MNNIQIFSSPQFGDIRVSGTSEQPLFCLVDICRPLGLEQITRVKSNLDEDGVTISKVIDSMGREQDANFVTESGLYQVIFQSRKPEAKQFRKWVTSEVLPSIRKHGAYMTQDTIQKAITNPDFLIQLATELKVEQQRRIEAEETSRLQQEQLKIAAPKVQYVDEVLLSSNTYVANSIAKELGMSAETMNRKLNEKRVIYREGGVWVLYSKYQSKGYTKTRTHTYTRQDGTIGTSMLTVWTETGRQFIHSLFKS